MIPRTGPIQFNFNIGTQNLKKNFKHEKHVIFTYWYIASLLVSIIIYSYKRAIRKLLILYSKSLEYSESIPLIGIGKTVIYIKIVIFEPWYSIVICNCFKKSVNFVCLLIISSCILK